MNAVISHRLLASLLDAYSVPSLLSQAARSAAEADGLEPPKADDSAVAAATLTSIGIKMEDSAGMSALDRARSAVAAQAAHAPPKPVQTATTAGSAAHAMMSGGAAAAAAASIRKMPVAAPPAAPSISSGIQKEGSSVAKRKVDPRRRSLRQPSYSRV